MFGLPLSTVIVAFGIPLLIIAALIWWGMRSSMRNRKSTKDSNL